MAVKYVKDFMFPADRGFHGFNKMPARAGKAVGAPRMESMPKVGKAQGYAEGGRVPGYDMDRLPAKKPPGRGMDLAPSKPEKGEYQGYAKGGMSKGEKKISKVMGEYKRGKLHSGSKKGPKVKSREQAVAIALSEARKAGAKIPKKAEGGPLSYAESGSAGGSNVSFKEAFRKAREQGLKEFSWKGDRYSTKLKEETKRESKVEEKAPKAEAARKGPESRGGKRNVSEKSEVKRERKMELPSDRGSGFRSQAEETGMSASERAEKARGYAEGLMNVAGAGALLRAPAKAAAKSLMRKASEFVGGRKMKKQAAEEAARKATPEYKEKAAQMEKFAEQMRARQKMGTRYEEGGEVMSKGPKTRYSAARSRRQARERAMERWAEQRMRHAEKYAPGLSLDMADKKSKGGMPVHRRKPMYGNG